MDSGELPPGRFPGKELHGSKSPPVKIKKDSPTISKKPPVPPRPPLMEARSRAPVVIYEVPRKRIKVHPKDFKSLVQRLTGWQPSSSSSSSAASSSSSSNFGASSSRDVPMVDIHQSGAVTQAARYASIDRVVRANPNGNQNNQRMSNRVKRQVGLVNEMGMGNGVEMTQNFPGILSPGSSSFSPVQTNFFPPITADPSSVNFFPYLNPHGNTSFFEGNHFLTGPSTSVSQPEQSSANFFHDLSPSLHGNRSFVDENPFLTGLSTSVSKPEPSSANFFHDLSPIFHGNRSFDESNPFLTSPSTSVSPTELHGNTSFIDDNPFLTSSSTFVSQTNFHGNTSFIEGNPFLASSSIFVEPAEPYVDLFDTFFDL